MRSDASKPSSDAGLRPIQDFLPLVVDLVSHPLRRRGSTSARNATATPREDRDGNAQAQPARQHAGTDVLAKQMTAARPGAALTGRGSAPSGVPGSTQVRTGGEGSPSREVEARPADAGAPAQPFAWWSSPTQRAQRAHSPAPIAPPTRRPFSRPNLSPHCGSESASQKAEIFPFTGSNTPYQSHE